MRIVLESQNQKKLNDFIKSDLVLYKYKSISQYKLNHDLNMQERLSENGSIFPGRISTAKWSYFYNNYQ